MKLAVLLQIFLLSIMMISCGGSSSGTGKDILPEEEAQIVEPSPIVNAVTLTGNELSLTGENMATATMVTLEGHGINEEFDVDSKTSTSIVATAKNNFNLILGMAYNLIVTNAYGAGGTTISIVAGGMTIKNADFTVTTSDNRAIYLVTGSTTVTMSSAAAVSSGFEVTLKRIGDSRVTIATEGSETLDDHNKLYLDSKNALVKLISDGANWRELNNMGTVGFYDTIQFRSPVGGITCPVGYIAVPGDATFSTSNFCVAKYEMKAGPTSEADNAPWVGVSRNEAKAYCEGIGDLEPSYDKFYLITNEEWLTIARNIEGVAGNWDGTVINRGHSNNAPAAALAASSDDNNACYGYTDSRTCDSSTWHLNRRTHTLGNGEVVWDMAGNVQEWIDATITSSGSGWTELNAFAAGSFTPDLTGTEELYQSTTVGHYSANGIGKLFQGVGGAVRRGGKWSDDVAAGLFTMVFNADANLTTSTDMGFRCVYRP